MTHVEVVVEVKRRKPFKNRINNTKNKIRRRTSRLEDYWWQLPNGKGGAGVEELDGSF